MKQLLVYEGKQIRSITKGDEVLFAAHDVCKILDVNFTQTRRLSDDEKGLHLTHTPGGRQKMLYVNEYGLYSLILGSRKAESQKFKRWVTHEVLPSIRKTGAYQVETALPDPDKNEERERQILKIKKRAEAFLEVVDAYEHALRIDKTSDEWSRSRGERTPNVAKTLELLAVRMIESTWTLADLA